MEYVLSTSCSAAEVLMNGQRFDLESPFHVGGQIQRDHRGARNVCREQVRFLKRDLPVQVVVVGDPRRDLETDSLERVNE